MEGWPDVAKSAHAKWWEARIARQKDIDDSIVQRADEVILYDRPYVDNSKVRVAGPFTVESLSPHKVIAVDDDGEFLDNADAVDGLRAAPDRSDDEIDFGNVILEHLRTAGVQQAHKEDRIKFTSINPFQASLFLVTGGMWSPTVKTLHKTRGHFHWPGIWHVGAGGYCCCSREARDLAFDVLVCCAFNYDAHSWRLTS